MEYRFAQPGPDLQVFEEMLRRYLAEQQAAGGAVQLTRKTVDWYRDLARIYVHGSGFGVVVFAEEDGPVGRQPVGFAMAGEDLGIPRIDTTLGKVATVWITWVDPTRRKTGAGLGMLLFGRPRLLELGFETAAMSVREENTEGLALCHAFGAQPVERFLRFRLEEEPGHGR